jgi:mRNA deadenylase 3'-5' endonuclease subunit Ccr4
MDEAKVMTTINQDNCHSVAHNTPIQITTWNTLNPAYEVKERYPQSSHNALHWNEGI